MLRISIAALFLYGMGFVQVIFSLTSKEANSGESFTIWCSHNINVPGELYWFKQTDGSVPITIVRISHSKGFQSYTDNPQNVDHIFFNGFKREHLAPYLFNKSTNLIIKNVTVSDSGFYFCGTTGDQIKFTNGTRLKVKERNVKSRENDTRTSEKDHDKSPVSTEDACSRDIFFKLTLLFGCIIVFTCIIPLIWGIIRKQKRQMHKVAECQAQQHEDKENDSVEYAAVHFKRPKTSRRHAEDSVCAYKNST